MDPSRSRDAVLDTEPYPSPRVDARGIGLSVWSGHWKRGRPRWFENHVRRPGPLPGPAHRHERNPRHHRRRNGGERPPARAEQVARSVGPHSRRGAKAGVGIDGPKPFFCIPPVMEAFADEKTSLVLLVLLRSRGRNGARVRSARRSMGAPHRACPREARFADVTTPITPSGANQGPSSGWIVPGCCIHPDDGGADVCRSKRAQEVRLVSVKIGMRRAVLVWNAPSAGDAATSFGHSAAYAAPVTSSASAVNLSARSSTSIVGCAWSHRQTAAAFMGVVSNRAFSACGTSIRRPFRCPLRTWRACNSPRLTRCNTVWRETPRVRIASTIGT